MTPENISASWEKISDMSDARLLQNGGEQTLKILSFLQKRLTIFEAWPSLNVLHIII